MFIYANCVATTALSQTFDDEKTIKSLDIFIHIICRYSKSK